MAKRNNDGKRIASAIGGNLSTPMDFIAYVMVDVADGVSKAALARAIGVSTRTIGRMVERVRGALSNAGIGYHEIDDLEVIKAVHKSVPTHVTGEWDTYAYILKCLESEGVPPIWGKKTPPVEEDHVKVGPDPVPEDCVYEDEADEEVPSNAAEYAFVLTGRSLVLTRYPESDTDQPETVTILPSEERFTVANQRLMGILPLEDSEQQKELEALFGDYSTKEKLKSLDLGKVHVDFTMGTVEVEISTGETVPVTGSVVNRIMSDENPERLAKFIDNLYENPSYRSITGLFDFLQATDIEIDDEGYVIAMKVITNDYLDCHTRTIDNSVGALVKMDRRLVDDDPDSLCSSGLHACSESYISHFRSGDNRLVKVRIHPKDFVSVPKAYTRTVDGGSVASKARVCEYTVIEEVF